MLFIYLCVYFLAGVAISTLLHRIQAPFAEEFRSTRQNVCRAAEKNTSGDGFGVGEHGLTLILLDIAVEDAHGKTTYFFREVFYEGEEEYLFCMAGS